LTYGACGAKDFLRFLSSREMVKGTRRGGGEEATGRNPSFLFEKKKEAKKNRFGDEYIKFYIRPLAKSSWQNPKPKRLKESVHTETVISQEVYYQISTQEL